MEEIRQNIAKKGTNPQENCGNQAFSVDFAAQKSQGIERQVLMNPHE
jgi:hypothetical protein